MESVTGSLGGLGGLGGGSALPLGTPDLAPSSESTPVPLGNSLGLPTPGSPF